MSLATTPTFLGSIRIELFNYLNTLSTFECFQTYLNIYNMYYNILLF
jgi:hypothetical protein